MKREATAVREAEGEVDQVDAIPRLDGGDANSAPTEVRELPEGLIALLKNRRREEAPSDGDLADAVELAAQIARVAATPTAPPVSGIVPKMYTQWDVGDNDELSEHSTRICGDAVASVLAAASDRVPPLRRETIRPSPELPSPSASASPTTASPPLGAASALFAIAPPPRLPAIAPEPARAPAPPRMAWKVALRYALYVASGAVVGAGLATVAALAL